MARGLLGVVILGCVLMSFGRQIKATRSPSSKSFALPLSPLFGRLAYEMNNQIAEWARVSDKPINEGDYDSSPFVIRQRAIERELNRIEEFDLKTKGDRQLFDMLTIQETLVLQDRTERDKALNDYMEKITRHEHADPPDFGRAVVEDRVPHINCWKTIREAISRRAWTTDGACVLAKRTSSP